MVTVSISVILLIIAAVCFFIAATPGQQAKFRWDLTALGLFCLTINLLIARALTIAVTN